MSHEFVGRQPYLKQIQDHLYHIMSGQPRILLIEGEAGIGKSRFLQEVMTLSENSGVQVCSGYGSDTFSRPYEPFSGLFPVLQYEGVWSVQGMGATVSFPTLPFRPLHESTFDWSPSDQRCMMLDVATATISCARQAPLMVIVDDLHLADAPSLELFDYLATELAEQRDVPVLLLGSYRPQMTDTLLMGLLTRLREQASTREIQLGNLSDLETRALIEAWSRQFVTQQLVDRVQSLTRGVPFYIEQLMLYFSHQGALVDQAGYLGLRDVASGALAHLQTPEGMIGPRLDSLPAPVYDMLTVGAFLSEPFSLQLLARVASVDELAIGQSLAIARNHGLLVGELDFIQFAHALVRDVLQNRLSTAQRQQVHCTIACALEALNSGSSDDSILLIAHHIVQAGSLVDVAHMVTVTEQAGDRAMQIYAWSEAVFYYEAGLSAMERQSGYGPADLARYYYQTGVAHVRNQDVGPSVGRFEQAVQAYMDSGDKSGLASALIWLTRLGFTKISTPFGVLPPYSERLRHVLHELGDAEPILRGYMMETLSQAYRHGRLTDDANEMAVMAQAIGQEHRDHKLTTRASAALAMVYAGRLEMTLAMEHHSLAIEAADKTDDLIVVLHAAATVPLALHLAGDFDTAQSKAKEIVHVSRLLHDWAAHSKSLSYLASTAAAMGEFDTVEQLVHQSLSMASRSRYPFGAYRAVQTWAFTLAVRGLWQEAEEALDMIVEPGLIFREPGDHEKLLTGVLKQLVYLYQGQKETEPIAPLCRAFFKEARADSYSLAPLCATIELAELSYDPGLVDVPVRLLSSVVETGVLFTSGWVFSIPRVLGVAAVLQQEWEVAAAHFAHALQTTIDVGAWPEYSRACLDYARMVLLAGDEDCYLTAIEMTRKSTNLLYEFGMSLHARRGTKLCEMLAIAGL